MQSAPNVHTGRTELPSGKGKTRPDTPNLNTAAPPQTPLSAFTALTTPFTALFSAFPHSEADTPLTSVPPSAADDTMEKKLRFAMPPSESEIQAHTADRVKTVARELQHTHALVKTLEKLLHDLGPHTQRQADVLPAIKAQESLVKIVNRFQEQSTRHRKEIENMQKRIDSALTKGGVLAKNKADEEAHIRERVKQEVAKKVRAQMDVGISDELRMNVTTYKRQVVEVEHSLYNADARRRNGLLGATYKIAGANICPVLPELQPDADSLPLVPPNFPPDMMALMRMPDKEIVQLMTEVYCFNPKVVLAGLPKPVGGANAMKSDGYKQRRRSVMLNYLMQYLGIPFHTTATAADTQAGRIVITRRRC